MLCDKILGNSISYIIIQIFVSCTFMLNITFIYLLWPEHQLFFLKMAQSIHDTGLFKFVQAHAHVPLNCNLTPI